MSFGLQGSETFLFVAVLKLRLAIIDNLGCAGFEFFFLVMWNSQRLGRKNQTYCGGVEDFSVFYYCIWDSETGNGKKVLGCEGFESNFAFGNSQSGNQRYWDWCGRLEFLLAFETLLELPRFVLKNMHFLWVDFCFRKLFEETAHTFLQTEETNYYWRLQNKFQRTSKALSNNHNILPEILVRTWDMYLKLCFFRCSKKLVSKSVFGTQSFVDFERWNIKRFWVSDFVTFREAYSPPFFSLLLLQEQSSKNRW